MKWEVTYAKGAFEKLRCIKNDLPINAHYTVFNALEHGVLEKILKDLRDEPPPRRFSLYAVDFNFTIISEVNYSRREIAIFDVKHGYKRI